MTRVGTDSADSTVLTSRVPRDALKRFEWHVLMESKYKIWLGKPCVGTTVSACYAML